ncbi:transposase [Rhodococcus corynebacterioides]|uniref:Transposase n=1 Tax=Rhodococcoides corynebacterioides TaxID=53972 RepID=A0ABS7P6T9_9NOCA|nr:transposase [Rhodococcus corynebacterioides]MBY6409873.1 transposase [Rhodococcus corynebacterioides]
MLDSEVRAAQPVRVDHRTLAGEWDFARQYSSERARRVGLPGWLHTYDHHRQHSAIGKATPISRLTNVPGQYS